jgi:hypothetical protein
MPGPTRDTGFLRNLISYDGSGNIVLPANLTVTGSLLTSGGATYATQSYVTTQISNLVNAAPGALDTLNELAAALGNDANFSTTVTNSIATKLALSGGTLTGALNGTSAEFSSSVTGNGFFVPNTNQKYFTTINGSNGMLVNGSTGLVVLMSGGNETLTLNNSGKVGIGTTSPNKALEILSISDQLRLSYNASTYTDLRSDSAGGLLIKAGGSYIIQYINGSEKSRLTSSGNLILSTSDLGDSKLQVGGHIRLGTWTTPGSTYIGFGRNDSGSMSEGGSSGFEIESVSVVGDYSQNVHLRTHWYNNGSRRALTALYNGNIGIGTTSPYALLTVYSGTAGDRILIDSANGTGSNGAIAWGAGGVPNISARIRGIDDGYYGTHLLFETRGASGPATTTTERLRIAAGGNIGIGVTSPSWKLSVANETVIGAQGGSDYTYISGGSGYGSVIRNYYATGTINNEFRGNGNNYVNLGYGSFGIGTSSPIAKLHVSGGKIIHTSDDGGYGQFQINASTTSTEATILLSNGGSGVNNGNYTNVGVIGMGAYGNARDTLVIGTGYNAGSMFMKNGTTTFSGNVINSANYKGLTFVQLTSCIGWSTSVTNNTQTTISTTGLGLPSGVKAISVVGWYHVRNYGAAAGQGDHAMAWFGISNDQTPLPWSDTNGGYPYSSNTFTRADYGSFVMEHDGDSSIATGSSGGPHYYGSWHNGIINVNANGTIYCNLASGYSGGTHYFALYIQGYWI